jgi:hypothetical protein
MSVVGRIAPVAARQHGLARLDQFRGLGIADDAVAYAVLVGELALQSGQATLLGAERMLTQLSRRGRNGCGVFRRVLDTRALKAASPHPGLLEPRMARLLVGLPTPAYQHKVFDAAGQFVAQVDFAYPDLREAFEVDGFEAHGTPEAMTHGVERDHRLRAAGWNVTHFTWHQVVRQPRHVVRTVAGVLGAHSRTSCGCGHQEGGGVTSVMARVTYFAKR